MTLPQGCQLRRAVAQDSWQLRTMVLREFLDPTQIRWQNFWVIEREQQIIGCVQLRQFTGAQELGSLVVKSPWRHQGLGTCLTLQALKQATQPLYLECVGEPLARFYQNFGFEAIALSQLPHALQEKFRWGQWARQWLKLPVFIMHCQ